MPATTRRAGGLAALTAGLTLTAAGLTLTGCDTTTTAAPDATAPDATAPPCRTASLTWTLSLLDDTDSGSGSGSGSGKEKGHGGPRPNARLIAVNKGSAPCVFAGYPSLEIHNGKAESIEGAGPGHPAALPLSAKAAVTVDLRYTPRDTKGADAWCVRQGEAVVRAPHDTGDAVVPVTDARGKAATLDACGDTIAMTPGRLAQSALRTETPL